MKSSVLQMMLDVGMGSNATCRKCRSTSGVSTNALGPYNVCDAQYSSASILFVGKLARGDSFGTEIGMYLEDVSSPGKSLLSESAWAFFSYTREIIETVFGDLEEGLKRVSFTNLVKCNNESTLDTASEMSKQFCIQENGFIWREVELIRPKIIVLYTNTSYDSYLEHFTPHYALRYEDNERKYVEVGEKYMPWWDRSFVDEEGRELTRLLRVGHPMYKNKTDYVALVSKFIISHLNRN